ncbi:MAG: DJ-1/PfpI family protein [Candidatus Heimdallarchaeota archaeon]
MKLNLQLLMPKKNAYVFLYNKFADFEISQVLLLLIKDYNIITVGFEEGLVRSYSNLQVKAEIAIQNLDVNEVDIFIIPGGEPKEIIGNDAYDNRVSILNEKLMQLNEKGKIIAAVCGGPTFLANAGILDNIKCTASISEDEEKFYTKSKFSKEDFVVDGNILTAQGQAFSEFAVQLARMCDVIKTNEEMKSTLDWLRNKKN